MIYTSREFERYSIAGSDGPIGSVKDAYFNDHSMRLCYFVVETGSWLNRRRVWLATHRLTPVPTAQWLTIDATRDEVRNSPDVGSNLPVSREHDRALANYFRSRDQSGSVTDAAEFEKDGDADADRPNDQACARANGSLRSARQVRGNKLVAQDGPVGEIQDILVDVPRWDLRYLVVDTARWLAHRSVLIAPQWIGSVTWDDSVVAVNLAREEVIESSTYPLSAPFGAQIRIS